MLGLYPLDDPGEVHMVPLPGYPNTPCCNQHPSNLHEGDRLTTMPSEVTCPVNWSGRAFGSITGARALGEVQGSVERLSAARARLIRASSSEINASLREELLRLIDRGE